MIHTFGDNDLCGLRVWNRSTMSTLLQATFHKTLSGAQDFQSLLWGERTGPKAFDKPWRKEETDKDQQELKIQDLLSEIERLKGNISQNI